MCVCYEICIWPGLHSQLLPADWWMCRHQYQSRQLPKWKWAGKAMRATTCWIWSVSLRRCVLAFFSSTESSDSNLQLRPGLADTLPQPCWLRGLRRCSKDIEFRFLQRVVPHVAWHVVVGLVLQQQQQQQQVSSASLVLICANQTQPTKSCEAHKELQTGLPVCSCCCSNSQATPRRRVLLQDTCYNWLDHSNLLLWLSHNRCIASYASIQLYALVKSRLIDFEGLVRSCLVLRVFPNSFDLYSA